MQLSRPLHYMPQTDENAGGRSCLETISGWDISASTFRTLVMSSQVRILEARGLGFPWAGRAKSGSGKLWPSTFCRKAELGSAWRPGIQRHPRECSDADREHNCRLDNDEATMLVVFLMVLMFLISDLADDAHHHSVRLSLSTLRVGGTEI